MNAQNPKIALYVQRSFGDKLTAAFSFFNENWKLLIKYCTYFLLPVCILQALFMNKFLGAIDGASTPGFAFFTSYGLLLFFSVLGMLLMFSLVYALMILYQEREERLQGLTMAELKPVFFRCMGRLFMLGLFIGGVSIFIIVIIGILVTWSKFTLFLIIPAFLVCIIPMALFVPVYLLEKIDIWSAFLKSFRLGFATWGGIFGMLFVMGFITNILQGVAAIPWYVALFVGIAFSKGDVQEAISNSIGASLLTYVFGVLMFFGVYISMIFPMLGMMVQYGHACEKMEHISVVDDIDKFEQL